MNAFPLALLEVSLSSIHVGRGQLWLLVFGEPCSWCPRAPLDFWLSEQTAAGERGVKMSERFLIDKTFKEFGGRDITLCNAVHAFVLSEFPFASLLQPQKQITAAV